MRVTSLLKYRWKLIKALNVGKATADDFVFIQTKPPNYEPEPYKHTGLIDGAITVLIT